MTNENYAFFENNLLAWYKNHGRNFLPWRKPTTTPYEVWVSEIMLQQTQVNRVIPYYTRFLDRFPTISSLASATWEEFYPYYAGLGYYRRGRNMLLTAQIIVRKYNGQFPVDKKFLVNLPGIGEYTANAILSFGYNQNEIAYDTNAQRMLGRFFAGSKDAIVKNINWNEHLVANKKDLNAATMDFSNRVCLKKPLCAVCPLQKNCDYFKNNGTLEPATTTKKSSFPTKEAQTILFLHENHSFYFSSTTKYFQPFILSSPYNTRDKIKQYFKENFQLELAVRPPHKKIFVDSTPTFVTNAQILLGQSNFTIFTKKIVKPYLENIKNLENFSTTTLSTILNSPE